MSGSILGTPASILNLDAAADNAKIVVLPSARLRFICVSAMSNSEDEDMQSSICYISPEQAIAMATHLTTLAEELKAKFDGGSN